MPEHRVTGRPRTGVSAPSCSCHLGLRVTCPWGPGGMWDPAGEGRRAIPGKGDKTSTGRSWKGQGREASGDWSGQCGVRMAQMGKAWSPSMGSRVSCGGGNPRRCGLDPGGGGGGNVVLLMATAGCISRVLSTVLSTPRGVIQRHSFSQPAIHSSVLPFLPLSAAQAVPAPCWGRQHRQLPWGSLPLLRGVWQLGGAGWQRKPLSCFLSSPCTHVSQANTPFPSESQIRSACAPSSHLESPALLARSPFFCPPPPPPGCV